LCAVLIILIYCNLFLTSGEEIGARCQYSLFPRRPLPPLYAFKFLIFVNIAVDGGGKIVI